MANTYYVSPTGEDTPFGGSRSYPWASINFGDQNNMLRPGDTVIVMAGTYIQNSAAKGTISLCSGTADRPITYIAQGKVIIDGQGSSASSYSTVLLGSGIDYVIFDGFEVKGGKRCINITGTDTNPCVGNIVRNCIFHDPNGGYMMQNARIKDCQIYNSLFYISDGSGYASSRAISTGYTMYGNKFWNDTFYLSGGADTYKGGIFFSNVSAAADASRMGTDEVRNCIIWPQQSGAWGFWTFNTTPIYTPEGCAPGSWNGIPFVHSHNMFQLDYLGFQWVYNPVAVQNLYGAVNSGYPVDHESYADPFFLAPFMAIFTLGPGSPAVDEGVDEGLAYNGTAPDIGVEDPLTTDKPAEAFSKRDGTVLNASNCVATVANGVFKDEVMYVEVESQAGGVKVMSMDPLPTIQPGDRVSVSGTLVLIDGQKTVLGTVSYQGPGDPVKPLGAPGKSLSGAGLDSAGLLATTWGRVTFKAADGSYFCIDDGSGKTDGLGNKGIPVVVSDMVNPISTLPNPNANPAPYVIVTGLVGKKDLGGGSVAVINPRSATDIK
jgi:hypothetical protein